jgi:hypothetical protein
MSIDKENAITESPLRMDRELLRVSKSHANPLYANTFLYFRAIQLAIRQLGGTGSLEAIHAALGIPGRLYDESLLEAEKGMCL